jgi:hypothetical protein
MTPEERRSRKNERNRKWRAANAEKQREGRRKWRAANAEKERERRRAWYAANPEKERERVRAWYAANLEKERKRERVRYAADPYIAARKVLVNKEGLPRQALTTKLIAARAEKILTNRAIRAVKKAMKETATIA